MTHIVAVANLLDPQECRNFVAAWRTYTAEGYTLTAEVATDLGGDLVVRARRAA